MSDSTDKFLAEIVEVCRRHKLSLVADEDGFQVWPGEPDEQAVLVILGSAVAHEDFHPVNFTRRI